MLTALHAKNSTLKAPSDRVGRDVTLVGLFNVCEYELADQIWTCFEVQYIGIEDFYRDNDCRSDFTN